MTAFLVILVDKRGQRSILAVGLKSGPVKSQAGYDRRNFFFIQVLVVLEQGVMKLPEFPLPAGGQG